MVNSLQIWYIENQLNYKIFKNINTDILIQYKDKTHNLNLIKDFKNKVDID